MARKGIRLERSMALQQMLGGREVQRARSEVAGSNGSAEEISIMARLETAWVNGLLAVSKMRNRERVRMVCKAMVVMK